MENTTSKAERARTITIDALTTHCPFYRKGQPVYAVENRGLLCIAYRIAEGFPSLLPRFDLNILSGEEGNECIIADFRVEPRGQGRGTQLWKAVNTICSHLDVKTVKVYPSGPRTYEFYEKKGFTRREDGEYWYEMK